MIVRVSAFEYPYDPLPDHFRKQITIYLLKSVYFYGKY